MLEKISKETLEKIVSESISFPDVCIKLGYDPKTNIKLNIERKIRRLKISTTHFETIKNKKNRWNKEKIEDLIKISTTYKEILLEIGYLPIETNYKKLKKLLKEWNLEFIPSKFDINKNWGRERVENAVKSSFSYRECLRKLDVGSLGGNHNTLKKYIKLYNIETTHFELPKTSNKKKDISEYLIENSNCSRTNLKKRLLDECILVNKCCLCGQTENWNGLKISLILDHINGINNDNRLENLRIVCPNCNAGLETFAGKNIKTKIN